jgi:glutamate/tyrosine decarboxylase-like PLP-dependent enzyme
VQAKLKNEKMNNQLQNDLEQIDILLEKVKIQGIDFLKNINSRPTSTNYKVKISEKLPENGIGTFGALQNFNNRFENIIVSSSGPRYWGYVTGGTTPASIVGDWLTSIYDQNSQETDAQGDISANIEIETIKLLLDLFELPNDFFGGFVTGATMSSFTCLAVARQWLGKQLGKDFAKEGITQKINILTATPHSSALKALSLLGIGSSNVIKVKTIEGNREAIDLTDFENKIETLKGEPFIFIGSGGTVNTVDFDDFVSIAKLKVKYNFWWHIDAAFGGFAVCSDSHKHLLKGWENSDSITIDCHKWLNVPYESAVFFVKEKYNVLQVETFQNSNAPYLGDPMEHFDYLNFLPENSRRLKALPVWFSLIAYGKEGIKNIVENNIEVAELFGQFIEQDKYFELLAPVRLNTVCFTLNGTENQEKVKPFLIKLNETGKVFMTPTKYNNKIGIRAAFVNWRTTETDIKLVTDLMKKIINES